MSTNSVEKKTFPDPSDPVADVTATPRPMVAMAKDFESGHVIPFHQHHRAQLLYASSGVMTVSTASGVWVVPPLRALWIPAGTHHQILVSGTLAMRTIYFDPKIVASMPQKCCVVTISPLLRELILHATTLPRRYGPGTPAERVFHVLLDQLRHLRVAPLELPIPGDPRLKQMYDRLSRRPDDQRTLEDWGKSVGATGRTLTRLFRSQIGMGFRQWRQQIRILEALKRIGIGEPVTSVALSVGYDSPSAFIAMFKKALGMTPGRYFDA